VAAVFPISRPHAIASGLRYKAVAIALAVWAVTALIRLSAFAPGADPAQNLRLPSKFTSTFLRQPPITRVAAAALEGMSRNTCVMALGESNKLFVGFKELSRDTIVSLAACDLHNASREAESIKLLGGASLGARNIFLSGGYALAAGATMTASRYLTTHTSPIADPYSRLEIPPYPGCTRTLYRLDEQKTETISPGVYCGGIEVVGGATLNLDPGTYILDRGNFVVSGNSTVSGTGVTLILTSRTRSSYGAIDIRPGSTIGLTAPALGAAAGIPGIAIWVDGHASAIGDRLDGGRTQNINGAIYLPGRQVKYSGGSPAATRCSQLIAHTVTFTGNSYFRHDCAGVGLFDPDLPSLVPE
jgi:hypothetical protein